MIGNGLFKPAIQNMTLRTNLPFGIQKWDGLKHFKTAKLVGMKESTRKSRFDQTFHIDISWCI